MKQTQTKMASDPDSKTVLYGTLANMVVEKKIGKGQFSEVEMKCKTINKMHVVVFMLFYLRCISYSSRFIA